MAWSEIETYKQLEQDYQHALTQFNLEESAYRAAADMTPPPPDLQERYNKLAAKRLELEAKLLRLREMRNNLAHKREEVAQELAL